MWKRMAEKKRRSVKKRDKNHIRHEASIPNMSEGLQRLFSQIEHFLPLKNYGISVRRKRLAVSGQIQPRMDDS